MRGAGIRAVRSTLVPACCLGAVGLCLVLLLEPGRPTMDLPGVERQVPAVVAGLRANGARVLSLGKRGGLDGRFVELADGDAYSLYLTADGHAVAGLLYGPDGTLVTGRQIAAARIGDGIAVEAHEGGRVPRGTLTGETSFSSGLSGGEAARDSGTGFLPEFARDIEGPDAVAAESGDISDAAAPRLAHLYGEGPQAPDAEALFERALSAFGFTLGQGGLPAVVFADPACRWSRAAVVRLAGAALDGRLRLRVVPVGVLGASSAQAAAAIATASDPALAWFAGAEADGPVSRDGGRRIARNNALFDAWGVDAVPLIAWRAGDGRVRHRIGDLDDIDAWLGALRHE